jgi:hypothetical protein
MEIRENLERMNFKNLKKIAIQRGIHRHWRNKVSLNVVAFNANGIGRQRYEVSKQLQEQRIDVALISDTHT